MAAKCFSCHNYHSSPANRYDTYSKAAGIAEEIVRRVSSTNPNEVMPTPSSAPLTEDEKQILLDFLELVNGGKESADYKVSLSWTAYKFPEFSARAGVSGTFDKIFVSYKHPDASDIFAFIKDAEILINSGSANISNDSLKSFNVQNYFFNYFTPVIHCKLVEINPSQDTAKVQITMNGISEEVKFAITKSNENLIFTGQIEDVFRFNAQRGMDSLQAACGTYHQNKVWPDISLKAEIKNYKNFHPQ